MTDDALLVLGAADVAQILRGREAAVMDVVAEAYAAHGRGECVVPHAGFLRFPGGIDRVIALPALLGGPFHAAGLKWIASFPANVDRGLARASGLVVLNDTRTGRPRAILEGSMISAWRTAASAAIAARALHGAEPPSTVGVLGCGAVNFEVVRFLSHVWPDVRTVVAHDLQPERAARFGRRCRELLGVPRTETASDCPTLMAHVPLLSIATTAMRPHIDSIGSGGLLRTVLHLSLRDLAAELLLAADNVVDDVEHVCRAETSIHLAEAMVGHRRFIRCELAEVLGGTAAPTPHHDALTIFSPFGLGILDIAVARLVCEHAVAEGRGTRVSFLSEAG